MSARLGSVTSKNKFPTKSSSKSADFISRKKKLDAADLNKQKIVQRILEGQENLLIVYQVREELIENVMKQCFESDIKKRAVSFMVKCAYKAMLQVLDLEFYVHDSGKDDFASDPEWTADEAPAPSPADTWAGYNVPFIREVPEGEAEDVGKLTSQESTTLTEMGSAVNPCSLMSEPCSLISAPYRSQSLSDYSECLLAPNVSEELMPESIIEAEDTFNEIEREKSLFTKIATLDTELETSRIYSEYKRKDILKLPKIPKIGDEKKSKTPEIRFSASNLPPLRADTILQRSQSPTKNGKRSESPAK